MNGDFRSLRINLGVLNRRCFGCGVGFRSACSTPTYKSDRKIEFVMAGELALLR